VLSDRGLCLSPGASTYQRIISNNSYTHDEQGVNAGQVRGYDGVLYKLWPLLMPWLAASRYQSRWRESQSRQMWLCPLVKRWRSVSQVARHWRSASQGWIIASPGLPDSRPRLDRAHLEVPDKLLTPTQAFLHPTQCTHAPHTLTNSPTFPGLAHWTDLKVSTLGSIVGWTPAR